MMTLVPKIISLEFTVPRYSYTQDEIFKALGYPRLFSSVYTGAGISKRHFCVPLDKARDMSWQQQCATYIVEAENLSVAAVEKCARDGVGKIDRLYYNSCTGFAPGPTIGHLISRRVPTLNGARVVNLSSMGCEAALPGISVAYDYCVAWGKPAMVVNCELCSLTYYPEKPSPDKENDYELLRGNALFADAAVAGIIGFDHNDRHPYILAMKTLTDYSHMNDLGYVWSEGRLRLKLSRSVPDTALLLIQKVVSEVMAEWELEAKSVRFWVVHAAGSKVLDLVESIFSLSQEQLWFSRQTLFRYGNCSSATVGITGKIIMEEGNPHVGDYGVMVNVGPGMTANAMLIKWGS